MNRSLDSFFFSNGLQTPNNNRFKIVWWFTNVQLAALLVKPLNWLETVELLWKFQMFCHYRWSQLEITETITSLNLTPRNHWKKLIRIHLTKMHTFLDTIDKNAYEAKQKHSTKKKNNFERHKHKRESFPCERQRAFNPLPPKKEQTKTVLYAAFIELTYLSARAYLWLDKWIK